MPVEAAVPMTRSRQRTILCIDDDVDSVSLVETILGHEGKFRLIDAATGAKGLELARRESPDLILLDFDLPDGHGVDVLKQLREDERTAGIPVIGVSATSHPDPHYIRGTGLNAFMRKPLDDIPAFIAAVERELSG